MSIIRKHYISKQNGVLVGIDEAGRGPLAGPVSVGVFVVRSRKVLRKFDGVKDSKQLSEKQREEWLRKIKTMACRSSSGSEFARNLSNDWEVAYTVSFSSVTIIDTKGISYAVRSAINRSLNRLERDGFINEKSKILLDGLLHAHPRFVNQKTIINGDATEPIIALASICAKVHRDRRMNRLVKKYPKYGFEVHKGYGTKAHYKAIKKHGISEIHRKSYLKRVI
jgi:ribonuclease HII